MPRAVLDAVLETIDRTKTGSRMLEEVRRLPVEAVYDPALLPDMQGTCRMLRDEKGAPRGHRIHLNPNFKGLAPSDFLVLMTVSHELAHAYLNAKEQEKNALGPLQEIYAYSASMRVWIELDLDAGRTSWVVKDFENKDLTQILKEMRAVYHEGLLPFGDFVRNRYHRHCLSERSGNCGEFVGLPALLEKYDHWRDAWAALARQDEDFRLKHLR